MKRIKFFAVAMLLSLTVSAQEKYEMTINAIDTWVGSEIDHETFIKNMMEGVFDNTFLEFGTDGILTVTRYQGPLLDLKKTEEHYQYKFDKDQLTLTANGQTKTLIYTLEYHSFNNQKSLKLFPWKDMTKELSLLVAGERGLKMKQDFDSMKEK